MILMLLTNWLSRCYRLWIHDDDNDNDNDTDDDDDDDDDDNDDDDDDVDVNDDDDDDDGVNDDNDDFNDDFIFLVILVALHGWIIIDDGDEILNWKNNLLLSN